MPSYASNANYASNTSNANDVRYEILQKNILEEENENTFLIVCLVPEMPLGPDLEAIGPDINFQGHLPVHSPYPHLEATVVGLLMIDRLLGYYVQVLYLLHGFLDDLVIIRGISLCDGAVKWPTILVVFQT